MKINAILLNLIAFICLEFAYSQTNNINITAILVPESQVLKIQQQTDFINKSNDTLNEVYFHNWANAYKHKQTPLAKRFIENYTKSFHFANEKHRGFTNINSISANYSPANFVISEENPDILSVNLNEPLLPGDTVKIIATYLVKIPNDKFTGYGTDLYNYNLRYWYLMPAIYSNQWHIYNNLDMDDLYGDFANYNITLSIPKNYVVNTDLDFKETAINNHKIITLTGTKRTDVAINLSISHEFTSINSQPFNIITNLNSEQLNPDIKKEIVDREIAFLEQYLGKFPHKKLFINKIEYEKNPVYGFSQLPSFLAPFSAVFEWDIQLFKIISSKYMNEVLIFNPREDAWLADGIQTYLMIKYVEEFYPEVKAIGDISKIWGIRNFHLAKVNFNEKYHFVNQFATRKNLDQALTTRADSLSNFNRKIVNKYKAGLGLRYLETYLDSSDFENTLKLFIQQNTGKLATSNNFLKLLIQNNSEKDLNWFTQDYLNTNKKIDYTLSKIEHLQDSTAVTIINKRNFTLPVKLYGIENKEIKYTQWLLGIDSVKTVKIPSNGFDRISLNYESLMPENNLRNNWKNLNNKLLNRPLQLKFLKDIENPYFNQFFYTPTLRYNYYDGVVLGLAISNKTFLNKSFTYKITPSFSTKSNNFSGNFSFNYEFLPENNAINKFSVGIAGSTFDYAENLSYTSLYPYALLEFRRKSLRDVSSKALLASYTMLNREQSILQSNHPETSKYGVFNLSFGYAKPDIIDDVRFSTGFQWAEKFSKLAVTAHFRKLTDTNRQFDFRFFTGVFLNNKTETDYFSFALDRPTDYLFQYDYLGRSETSGFFSQQIIINEGGFKSSLPVPYANQWMTTFNTSVGLWRWIEAYNDVGFVKNRNQKVYFAYESGFRLNFIQDILEVYFPFYSNLGWEVSQANYSSKIRFVLVIKPKRIYNFAKRGFY